MYEDDFELKQGIDEDILWLSWTNSKRYRGYNIR